MPVYVALLRAVNLGSRNKVRMEYLRELFTDLGHGDVATYLQSGNVVFTSPEPDPDALARDVEKRIADDLGLSLSVMLRSGDDLAKLPSLNPFLEDEDDPTRLHVSFLSEEPDAEAVETFGVPSGEPARFAVAGREVFLHYPDGSGRTKLTNAYLERRLRVAATSRNWRTTLKLYELTSTLT